MKKQEQQNKYRKLMEEINLSTQQIVVELTEGIGPKEAVVWCNNGEMVIDSMNFGRVSGKPQVDAKVQSLIESGLVKSIYLDTL